MKKYDDNNKLRIKKLIYCLLGFQKAGPRMTAKAQCEKQEAGRSHFYLNKKKQKAGRKEGEGSKCSKLAP